MHHFNGICIITPHVRQLSDFYSAVLQCPAEGDDAYAAISTQGAALSFYAEQGMERMAPGSMQGAGRGSFTLEIQVDDVDREYARLVEMGVPVVKSPTTQPWGWRSAWFRDPDGNILNFCAPVPAANQAAGTLDVGERSREYFQRLINQQDLSVCDELLSGDYIDHDAPETTPPGPQSIKTFVAGFLAEVPDLQISIEDQVTQGNRVALRMVWQGHYQATGAAYHQMGIVILRFNEIGQLAERWSTYRS
jgi:predicted enzyme related to lactoylglutathione lyase/predicted SnoaL-like aldol condensation-catalyzing enzyme